MRGYIWLQTDTFTSIFTRGLPNSVQNECYKSAFTSLKNLPNSFYQQAYIHIACGLQKCFYCYNLVKDTDKWGVCVQCSAGRCTTSFHVTCAMAAEVLFETGDFPFMVYITCNKHTANKGKVSLFCSVDSFICNVGVL